MNTKETLQKRWREPTVPFPTLPFRSRGSQGGGSPLLRFALFLIGCIGTRIFLMLVAKNINIKYLPYMGYVALIIAFGFAYIYLTGSRKTGGEVFGDQIWWNDLRPVHSALYFLFALYAINRRPMAWIYLAIDVVIGLGMFLMFHWTNGDIARLIM